jgi:uncharacterized protein YjbJ (UPF0337 family)
MNRDQVWGRFGEAKAKLKELAGVLAGFDELALRARLDFAAHRAQARFGDAKSAVEKRREIARRGRLDHAG